MREWLDAGYRDCVAVKHGLASTLERGDVLGKRSKTAAGPGRSLPARAPGAGNSPKVESWSRVIAALKRLGMRLRR